MTSTAAVPASIGMPPRARMRMTGRAWLQLGVEPMGGGGSSEGHDGSEEPRASGGSSGADDTDGDDVHPATTGAVYRQRAVYFPDGLLGRLYWWGISPFHALVFPSMARNIIAAARRQGA
jgi:hypothetical protein